ncbi:MAG: DUF624 domain-containing protein [Eubacteriales bacterium]|nr:DUF624 domain-containing protein [Eubacteriales bacterium]
MLHTIFNPDNVVFRAINKIGCLWLLNILWVICSLPIFTIGASTTALIYSTRKLRNDDGYPIQNFFASFKENFKQATLIWLIYLAAGAMLLFSIIFWNQMKSPVARILWAVSLFFAAVYSATLLYVFAIQSRFYNGVFATIKYAFFMSYVNIVETVLMGLIVFAVVVLNLFTSVIVNFITLNFGVALMMYLLGFHYEKVFSRYIP